MRQLVVTLSTCFALLFASGVAAQDVTGDLEGWIQDASTGEPIALVNVTVSGEQLQGVRSTVSGADGFFRVLGLPVGSYTITIRHTGYQAVSYQDIAVRLGRSASLGVTALSTTSIEMEEFVVRASQPPLDFSSADLGDNLNAEDLRNLPTPRDYREVIAYVPQANTSYLGDTTNIAGSTGNENQYFIEGVNVTEMMVGATGMRLPPNFVREVQIKKGGYEAEYGKSTGGIINVITHSGSNERRVDVFGYLTNNNFASDSRRGLGQFEQQDFDRYDFGASIGGPIVQDKLWYFVAYNPTIEAEHLGIPGLDFYNDKTISHLFAGKLTWSPNTSSSVDLAVFGDPTHQDRVGGDRDGLITPLGTIENPDPLLTEISTGSFTVSLSGRRDVGDRAIVEASVSRLESRDKAEAATERGRNEATYSDFITDTLSGGYQNNTDHHVTRWATELSSTVFVGSHEIKVGAAYEHLHLDEKWLLKTPDGGYGWLLRLDTDFWVAFTLLNDFEIVHRVPSLFLQDSWRVTDRLRLNAGLRWDGLYIKNPGSGREISINDGYQPRLGFSYRVDRQGESKVFGNYGRFFEQIPLIASTFWIGDFYQKNEYFSVNPWQDPSVAPDLVTVDAGGSSIVDDLDGQYIDEFTLGYERWLGGLGRVGVRGIYREIGRVIEDAYFPPDYASGALGNPGEGLLDYLPEPVRRYRALEFTYETDPQHSYGVAASYVLSKNYGNYTGAYDSDGDNRRSHATSAYWDPAQVDEGLLPNDRTHVFKLYGSYRFDSGLTAGTFFTWQSGTPLSVYGATPFGDLISNSHVVPRGSDGRTPSIWDLNVRLAYQLPTLSALGGAQSRLLFDVFHLFGQREVVDIVQKKYLALDDEGNQTGLNPTFGQALAFQPPMTIRVGVETSF